MHGGDRLNILRELLVITAFSELTILSIKKVMENMSVSYASNIIAVVSSVILAVAFKLLSAIYFGIAVDTKYIVEIIALAYLSFLSTTCGYDKVMQAVEQIKKNN
jgi:hypothetical protein